MLGENPKTRIVLTFMMPVDIVVAVNAAGAAEIEEIAVDAEDDKNWDPHKPSAAHLVLSHGGWIPKLRLSDRQVIAVMNAIAEMPLIKWPLTARVQTGVTDEESENAG